MSEINDTEELPEGIFPNNLKLIDQYQRKYPNLMAKYKNCPYKTGSFYVGSNTHLSLIRYKDNIVITLILQGYVLHWYHMYLLHPVMDRTEEMTHQKFY